MTHTDVVSPPSQASTSEGNQRRRLFRRITLTGIITWAGFGFFVVLALSVLSAVIVGSFAESWRNGWLPDGWTTSWYGNAWLDSGIRGSLLTTFQVAISVVVLALVAGVPAGYVLARKNFPGKSVLMLAMLLPIILPTMTYAVQLAGTMYRVGLGGTVPAVILVNLVPTLPLVILVTVPFVEQISPDVERAARAFGANSLQLFRRVLIPLLLPGALAAAVLVFVRVLAQFELTFFVAGARSETLVVTIFGALSDPGGRPAPLVAAMAVIYMVTALIGLLVTLRYSNPADALGGRM